MFERRAKYGNQPIVIDGQRFASHAEAKRWATLRIYERIGLIRDLERQVRYPLVVNGILIKTYTADARYVDVTTGELVIEDVKGYRVRDWPVTRKLMKALYNIDVQEVSQ